MKDSALIRILSSFTPDEMKSYQFFFDFHQRQKIGILSKFNTLVCKHHRLKFPEKAVAKHKLFHSLFPDKNYNDNKMRRLITDLKSIAEEYVKYAEMKRDELLQDRLLSKAYARKLLKKEFDGIYRKRKKKIDLKALHDRFDYLEYYLLLDGYYSFPETDRREIPEQQTHATLNYLDKFFVLSMLQLEIEQIARSRMLNQQPQQSRFAKYLNQYVDSLEGAELEIFETFRKIQAFQISPSSTKLNAILAIYKKHLSLYSAVDRKLVFKIIQNFMIQLYRAGKTEFLEISSKFYRFGLENKIVMNDNSLTIVDYLNAITSATRTGQLQWAFEIADGYEKYLPLEDKPSAIMLGKATIEMAQQNFLEVIYLLNSFQYRSSYLNHRYEFLMLKAHTELVLQGLNHYPKYSLFIHKLQEKHKNNSIATSNLKAQAIKNLVTVIKQIIKYASARKAKNLDKIEYFIINTEPLEAKKWLLQKIEFLKQQH